MQTILLVVGILALVLGALVAVMRLRTVYFGASAEGRVVGQSQSTSTSESGGSTRFTTLYAPIVEFTHAGKKHKFTSSLGVKERMAEGTKVPVRFLPGDPDTSAEIATPGRMWGLPIAALAIGAIFVVLSQVIRP
jgi:hypothetical protein